MSSAFINSLGSSFGSLTTTQTKSQSRTKRKLRSPVKLSLKEHDRTGVSDPHGKCQIPGTGCRHYPCRTRRCQRHEKFRCRKNSHCRSPKIADAIENKGTLKISRLKRNSCSVRKTD